MLYYISLKSTLYKSNKEELFFLHEDIMCNNSPRVYSHIKNSVFERGRVKKKKSCPPIQHIVSLRNDRSTKPRPEKFTISVYIVLQRMRNIHFQVLRNFVLLYSPDDDDFPAHRVDFPRDAAERETEPLRLVLEVLPRDQEDDGGAVDEAERETLGAGATVAAGAGDLAPERDVEVGFLVEELGPHHLGQREVGAVVMDEDVAAVTHDERLHLSLHWTH